MIIISHFPRRINKNLSFLLQKNSLFSPEFLKVFFRIRLLSFSPCGVFLMRRPPLYAFFPSPSHTFPIAAVFLLFPPLLFSLSNRLLYAPSECAFSVYLPPLRFKLFLLFFYLRFLFPQPSIFLPHSLFFILLISNFLYAARSSFPICRPFPRASLFSPSPFSRRGRRVEFCFLALCHAAEALRLVF